jgi:dTDP-4-amino-4,6-dideoxygalactose transaminase
MTEKVPLLDLKGQFRSLEKELREAIDRVLQSQYFILGPEVEGLEKEVAPYVGCRHAIGVSSGSDALLVALMALDLRPGDEVITTPFTFFATAGAVARMGARPVFVDIEPRSFNLDPERLAAAFTSRTKAVIPVHLFGQAAEMDPIAELCRERGVPIVEDAAQAIGTEYRGRRVCSLGAIGCLSFFPSKNLGALGDGGMVTTNDDALAHRLRILRAHGSEPKYYHKWIGGNFRLDALQAAVLRVKLRHLDAWSEARRRNADRYDRMFAQADLGENVITPWRRPGDRHIFNQYVLRVRNRDALRKRMTEQGVATEIYYPLSLHMQECFAYLGHGKGDFPESEKAAADSIAVPIYPELAEAQQARVVEVIREFYRS